MVYCTAVAQVNLGCRLAGGKGRRPSANESAEGTT
jgi:hypothetical protein